MSACLARWHVVWITALCALAFTGHGATVTLAWDPNSEPDLAGYFIHYGTASRQYTTRTNVGNVTTNTVSGLAPGITYYFAVTAYNTSGLESEFSNEIHYMVPVTNGGHFYAEYEAETAALAGAMRVFTNAQASQSLYIATTTAHTGTATFSVTVPRSATYVIWCRVRAPDTGHDSFFVSLDGGPEDVYDVAENTWTNVWQWTRVNGRGGLVPLTLNPRAFFLSAGTHAVVFRGRESGTELDRILVTDDLAFVASDAPLSPKPFTLADPKIDDGQPQFTVSGAAGRIVVIEISTNLLSWRPVSTNFVTSSSFVYTAAPVAEGARFFRVQQP